MTRADWKNLETASIVVVITAILSICVLFSCSGIYIISNANPGAVAKSLLENLKNLADITQTVVAILAVILGGLWSLVLFQSRRQRLPRASIEHKVTCRLLPSGKILLPVCVFVSNQSEVLLMCGVMKIWIQSINPHDDDAKKALQDWQNISEDNNEKDVFESWDIIALREHKWEKDKKVIEPGESHQFWFDFIIEPTVKTFRLYTHIREVDNPKIGWSLASIHDMDISNNEPRITKSEFTTITGKKSESKD